MYGGKNILRIQKFDLIVALYIFGVLCAELMGSKTFPLLHLGNLELDSSTAVFLMPLLFILPDVVVEVYGKRRAQSLVFSGLLVIGLLVAFSLLATHVPPPSHFAPSEAAYEQVFSYSARLAVASLTAFAASELLDVLIFSKLRQMLRKRALWLRNIVANVVSHLADSTIFLTLAFYSFQLPVGNNLTFLTGLIVPYWLLRSGLTVAETPPACLGIWWLRADRAAAPVAQHVTPGQTGGAQ